MTAAFSTTLPPEKLSFFNDPQTGLRAIIVVHSTALGPAAGGTRFWPYDDRESATRDALRLAAGMTYKNALAGLPFGGGKAVIMRPSDEFDRTALFAAYGRAVDSLGGSYLTAEDVGTTVSDMQAVRTMTRHVAGLPSDGAAAGGDPSPWTALGIFLSMQHAVERILGTTLEGRTVAIQGVGNVGMGLARLLHEAGAKLIVADGAMTRTEKCTELFGAQVVAPEALLSVEADVLAPCALGAVLNEASIARFNTKIICGGANNQLATPQDAKRLAERGILYAPDYLVNAGGIINVVAENLQESAAAVEMRVRKIPERLAQIFDVSERSGLSPAVVADDMARAIVADAGIRVPTVAAAPLDESQHAA
ncbi:amino acid dehydrogenase [Mesorhizobium sp. NBSH29]|uniref:Glu/Leu/Phe/Val dehydrogenase n=1 Tax=Mesorhizobium sp. NBSH29 TaxID=2654249 RepID=UPI001896A153|nr:Glu/Leu/Phe/Val dehydrogenase [Mesorhizobium sp. NBSH29]QPC88280.1 amino acid dehydrogenase [Mesorhizobium sp. NBSH29]